jgi:hypothetical protein
MKKLILLLLFITLITSCGTNGWSEDERFNYLKECVKGYKSAYPTNINWKGKNKYVLCWCHRMRDLTEIKYPTAKEADNANVDDIYTLSLLANEAAKIKCGEKPF